MSAMPAKAYLAISNVVAQVIRHWTQGNDIRQPAYMVARAALLQLRNEVGSKEAAVVAYQLADERAVTD